MEKIIDTDYIKMYFSTVQWNRFFEATPFASEK